MLDKLFDKIASAISFTAAYSCVASLCAIFTVGVLFGAADVGDSVFNINDPAESVDGALKDLCGTPLAVSYRIFSSFRVPVAAVLCGESLRLPTRPASTLWICLMICLQCGAGGFCGALVFVVVVVAIWKSVTRGGDWWVLVVVDLAVVVIAFAAPLLALVDLYPYRVQSGEQ